MNEFPRIITVKPLINFRLLVTFQNDVVKEYDCAPLLQETFFNPLHDESLFRQVQVGTGGYGVIWNDEIDLSESELWLNGTEAETLVLEEVHL